MALTVRDGLAILLRSIYEVTDSYGTSHDRPRVKAFLERPKAAPFETYLYVGRIPLANFYAHVASAFDKASLWQEIETKAGVSPIKQPTTWGVTTELVDLALWLQAVVK